MCWSLYQLYQTCSVENVFHCNSSGRRPLIFVIDCNEIWLHLFSHFCTDNSDFLLLLNQYDMECYNVDQFRWFWRWYAKNRISSDTLRMDNYNNRCSGRFGENFNFERNPKYESKKTRLKVWISFFILDIRGFWSYTLYHLLIQLPFTNTVTIY